MKELHPTQEKLLELLRVNVDSPLTMEELRERLEISSKSVIHHHISQLEKKGYLKRNPNNSKDYTILTDPDKPVVYLNMYGLAQCGADGFMLGDHPIERIPIASRLIRFSAAEAFIVEAKGDSMEPKIKQGDLVIAKAQTFADNGDIVVCVNNSVAIIKRLNKTTPNIILLESLNQEHPTIVAEDFHIVGVVKTVLNYN